jgi:hypothetical protein
MGVDSNPPPYPGSVSQIPSMQGYQPQPMQPPLVPKYYDGSGNPAQIVYMVPAGSPSGPIYYSSAPAPVAQPNNPAAMPQGHINGQTEGCLAGYSFGSLDLIFLEFVLHWHVAVVSICYADLERFLNSFNKNLSAAHY